MSSSEGMASGGDVCASIGGAVLEVKLKGSSAGDESFFLLPAGGGILLRGELLVDNEKPCSAINTE